MTFVKHVSVDTAIRAGFNYPDASFAYGEGGKIEKVYCGYINGTNIVVVEVRRLSQKGRVRYDFYFGIFHDKSRIKNPTGAEDINKIITRRNRVAARDLEMKIMRAVEEVEGS